MRLQYPTGKSQFAMNVFYTQAKTNTYIIDTKGTFWGCVENTRQYLDSDDKSLSSKKNKIRQHTDVNCKGDQQGLYILSSRL